MPRVWERILAKDNDLHFIHRSDANEGNCQGEGIKGQE